MKKLLCVLIIILSLSSLCACSHTSFIRIYKVVAYNELSLVVHDDGKNDNITYYVNGDFDKNMGEKYVSLNLKTGNIIKATFSDYETFLCTKITEIKIIKED